MDVLIGVGDPPIVLLLELVLGRRRIGVASPPELFDELVLFLGSRQVLEDAPLLWCDDVDDIFVQPLGVIILRLFVLHRLITVLGRQRCQQEGHSEDRPQKCFQSFVHVNFHPVVISRHYINRDS